ncbi:CHAT domain-containing protein [Lusitaniella coriacea LEGE 07157]|uniref:CHAT domain-containing protein n=1 Tax=Lusitaniella coriacea LEGE 07157 TaxID=945747 RepID=A0A8J7B7D7_9CYAN|nr:CHAT domain-containing protein [Lusitaniella coriacea]MBE9115309.1 CHAT domain-containing protein [Lusitaniella coriacea LEGE 07157]
MFARRSRDRKMRFILCLCLGIAIALGFPSIFVPSPIVVAQENPAIEQNARLLLQQGIELYETEQFSRAIELWKQSESGFAAQNDPLGKALANSNLSFAYQHLGRWEEAEEAIQKSFQFLTQSQDTDRSVAEIRAKAWNARGRLQWSKGQVQEALQSWENATRDYLQGGDNSGVISSKLNQAKALQVLGFSVKAEEILRDVYQTLQSSPDSPLKALGLRRLGHALRQVGHLQESQKILQQSLQATDNSTDRAATLLELGNVEWGLGDRAIAIGKETTAKTHAKNALQFYQQAAAIPKSQERLQAQLNQLSLLIATGQGDKTESLVAQIQTSLDNLPPSRAEINARLNFARSLTCLQGVDSASLSCVKKEWRDRGVRLTSLNAQQHKPALQLASAVEKAQQLQDPFAEAYALGQLGGLYELNRQDTEAKKLTEQALLRVETLQAPDIRYRWEWQLGRLLKAQGDKRGAIAAYTRSLNALKSVRHDLLLAAADVQFSFRDNVEPIYREYVDLLLDPFPVSPQKGTANRSEIEISQDNLKRAIQGIDALQLAELQNFLGCSLASIAKIPEDAIDPTAAIIYPIVLRDRIAIVFNIPGREKPLDYRATPIAQQKVEQTLQRLRHNLTEPGNTPEALADAQTAYNWLIAPLEEVLAENPQIKTLVFVPDGDLRNIPMGALYDGERYLIEKERAIAVSPRLKLFAPQITDSLKVFLGGIGIAQTIDNTSFSPIVQLREELAQISSTLETSLPLIDEQFTQTNIQQNLEPGRFSAIHWKTHGVFSSDPQETYLVAYRDRIKARDLNHLIQTSSRSGANPLELLVLSACETAQGDNRAVLGLAGIAVRTGARSTLSTLWKADDTANTQLMARFYQELSKPGTTKASALRQAQLSLLRELGYPAPYYWATYTLVGNWL